MLLRLSQLIAVLLFTLFMLSYLAVASHSPYRYKCGINLLDQFSARKSVSNSSK